MLTTLSGIEIVDIAKKIETWGVAFYDQASKHVDGAKARELFEYLRNEEKRHEAQFEKLLASTPEADGEWRDSEEYAGYMTALAENIVFPDPSEAKAMIAELDTEIAILNRAIDFEKESLLYFQEMRQVVREEDLPMLDHLVAEERKHLRLLRNLVAKQGS
jgi:rubrerythrin